MAVTIKLQYPPLLPRALRWLRAFLNQVLEGVIGGLGVEEGKEEQGVLPGGDFAEKKDRLFKKFKGILSKTPLNLKE